MSAVAEKKTIDDGNQKAFVTPAQERARLRLTTDKKQGIESPVWVKKIANRPL